MKITIVSCKEIQERDVFQGERSSNIYWAKLSKMQTEKWPLDFTSWKSLVALRRGMDVKPGWRGLNNECDLVEREDVKQKTNQTKTKPNQTNTPFRFYWRGIEEWERVWTSPFLPHFASQMELSVPTNKYCLPSIIPGTNPRASGTVTNKTITVFNKCVPIRESR